MRIPAKPCAGDDGVEAGEPGAAGVGLMDTLANTPEIEALKAGLEIGPESTLLCFDTEGATGPVNYRDLIWQGKHLPR